MSLITHLDMLKGSLAKRKEKVKLLDASIASQGFQRKLGERKHRLQNIINKNEINIEHLQEKIDYKQLRKKLRKKIPGGFTRFFKNDEEQLEFESLQMQLIMHLDDGTIPWE